jgi:acetoacetyl-CoA synthetase
VLCTVDGYRYNGQAFSLSDKVARVLEQIDSVEHVVMVDFSGQPAAAPHPSVIPYDRLVEGTAAEPSFTQLPADHPLYIMYSSGTTGVPKSIVHGAAGTLVKHLSEHQLHADIQPGSTVFWFTTCGWMMWNWLVSALASESTVVCYDGSPAYPDHSVLWRLAERHAITHFGVSPKLLAIHAKAEASPAELADLSSIRALMCTGSPLAPEQYDWAYAHVKRDMHLANVSGGTDLIGCFVASVPTLPVRRGEIQARALGMAVEAWDGPNQPVIGRPGELVCTKPFPSMPIGFWNDPDGSAYRAAYFEEHPGVWTHGDYVEIREHGGVVIYGRSDTTLNPGGVRIGTAEIYRAIEHLPEVVDSIVVARPVEGDQEIVLFVKVAEGVTVDDDFVERLRSEIRSATSPRHVPKHVFSVSDVPYTLSGKKVEKAVGKLLAGEPVDNRDALANPEVLDEYARLFEAG